MQEIAGKVFIEEQYHGVTLGVIATPRGLIQIDAPPSSEDARSWRAALMNLGGGMERALVNLDAHPDRTLGARAMDCIVIAHEKTANVFRTRPNTFKAQGEETGAEWESIPGLGSVRWVSPEISFVEQMTLHWGSSPILLEHRPGPSSGSIWAHLPEEKVVFVGDAVLKNQPPFLAGANLPDWVKSLDLLLSPEFKGYTIISGRGGVVTTAMAKNQLDFIKHVQGKIDKIATKKPNPASIEKMVAPLLTWFKAPSARQKQFAQRLRYGLMHYNSRPSQVSGQMNESQ
jgi:glyoxylase-like metal-dependent hydrolase (beta-lactamase superfamily II)